jgi:hypothetical protein
VQSCQKPGFPGDNLMFIVANKSYKDVVIEDLGIVVKKKQVIDLDRLKTKIPASESKSLRYRLSVGELIAITHPPVSAPPKIVVQKNSSSPTDMQEMKTFIHEEIQKIKPAEVNNDKILDAINKIATNISKNKIEIEDVDLDNETMVEIHSRKIEKLAKDAEATIEHKTSSQDDNIIEERASELEDLI